MEDTELALLVEGLNNDSPKKQMEAMNTIINTVDQVLGRNLWLDYPFNSHGFASVYEKVMLTLKIDDRSQFELVDFNTDPMHTEASSTEETSIKKSLVLITQAIQALAKAPDPYFIAERLPALGSIIIPPLEKLIETTERIDSKTLAALVLLQLGSDKGVAWLKHIIDIGGHYSSLAANSLATKGFQEVGDNILNYLRKCDLQEGDKLIAMITALEKLDIPLPEDIHQKLNLPEAPLGVQLILAHPLQRAKF